MNPFAEWLIALITGINVTMLLIVTVVAAIYVGLWVAMVCLIIAFVLVLLYLKRER